ncbi:MAG: Uma2 family endonuclease [Planctomycetota bacterium]
MATVITEKSITIDQFETMPFEFPVDLVRGEIVEMPPPGGVHGTVCGNVAFELISWTRRSDLGVVTANDSAVVTELDPDTVRGCDVAFVSWKRLPTKKIPKGAFRNPPDLVVEIMSPSDRWNNVLAKVNEYLDVGVIEVWIVDPEDRSVDVYRGDRKPARLANGQTLESADVLPGFSCPVADFFRHV